MHPSPLKRRIVGWITKAWLHAKFHLWQAQRLKRPVLERIDGTAYLVLPTVFNPATFLTGTFLVTALTSRLIPATARVLDLGCGAGAAAVRAAKLGAEVTAVDINPQAVLCTRLNTILHGVESRITLLQGDGFAPLDPASRFEVIVCNPPFYRGDPRHGFDFAWYFPPDLPVRIAVGITIHLAPDGYALILLSSSGECGEFLKQLAAAGFRADPARVWDLGFEVITLWRLRRTPQN